MELVNTLAALLELLSRKHADGVLGLVCGLLLALPDPALKALGVAEYTNQNGHIIGILFLVALACFILRVLRIIGVFEDLRQFSVDRTARKRKKRVLESLCDDEKKTLRKFAVAKNAELVFDRGDKAVITLVDKGVLLDMRPELNDFFPRRWYRVAPAYIEHLNSYL